MTRMSPAGIPVTSQHSRAQLAGLLSLQVCLGGSAASVAVGQCQAVPAPRAPALSKERGRESLLHSGCVNHPCIPSSLHSRAHPRVPPALPRSGRPRHLPWPGHADMRTLKPQLPAAVAPVTSL